MMIDTVNKQIFGQRLKYLMHNAKETTYSMAAQFKLSPPSISRYTRGEMAPKITTIRAIAAYFDVSPQWLMGHSVPMYDVEPLNGDNDVQTAIGLSVFKEIVYDKPVFSNKKAEQKLYLPSDKIVQWKTVFALTISDNSMAPDLMYGDTAVIQMSTDLKDCQFAALHVNESNLMIRKIRRLDHQLILQPLNSEFDAAVYDLRKDNIQMIGSVVYCRRISEFYF